MTLKPGSARFRRAKARLRQMLNSDEEMLRASCVKMVHPCGKSTCKCARGKKYHHVNWYLSQSKDGKQRMKSIPREYVQDMRRKTNAYKEARELLAIIGDEYWNAFSNKQKR
ncbi:MAG: DUF6788 family protein [Patescibacteria group bacterium]